MMAEAKQGDFRRKQGKAKQSDCRGEARHRKATAEEKQAKAKNDKERAEGRQCKVLAEARPCKAGRGRGKARRAMVDARYGKARAEAR
jgi:hypothetical protein